MSLISAHSMMSNDQGEIVQLTPQQGAQMKALIQTGVIAGNGVSDRYLSQIHPQLPSEFRSHLLAGWQKYLDGLDHFHLADQVDGIQLVQQWEQFKDRNADLLYERIIK